jgi:hypothetical protein
MKLAFYKGRLADNPKAKLFDIAVCAWTGGPYSHCELVLGSDPLTEAQCWSSSKRDGGIRLKTIDLTSGRWDVIEIQGDEKAAEQWFIQHAGQGYDVPGLFGFVLPWRTENPAWWFCSEACAAALKMPEAWRYHPNKLYQYFKPQAAQAAF